MTLQKENIPLWFAKFLLLLYWLVKLTSSLASRRSPVKKSSKSIWKPSDDRFTWTGIKKSLCQSHDEEKNACILHKTFYGFRRTVSGSTKAKRVSASIFNMFLGNQGTKVPLFFTTTKFISINVRKNYPCWPNQNSHCKITCGPLKYSNTLLSFLPWASSCYLVSVFQLLYVSFL